jgi:alkylation response protein AidB-like acyl-CoA dehydrogenase
MDFNLSETQLQLRETFANFFRREVPIVRVRDAEPLGFDPPLWAKLSDLGVVAIGVTQERDDDGAGLLDLALVAEEVGYALAPVPMVEAAVAARLMGRIPLSSELSAWFTGALDGTKVVSLAVRAPEGGVAVLAPAGAIADALVCMDEGNLILVERPDGGIGHRANLASMPLGDWPIAGKRHLLLAGAEAQAECSNAIDDWKVLTAATLVGLARRAHEIGLEFVNHREAFGRTIGSFQTVAHRLAKGITLIDGGQFLTYEAAWASDEGLDSARSLATAAYVFSSETAVRVTSDSMHFHGGVGYTLEQDIQLYFRRAKGWPLVLGDPRREYQVIADELWGKRRSA